MRSLIYEKPVECVRSEGGGAKLTGYAAVYYDEKNPGTEYRMFEKVRERIMPGAFESVRGAEAISTYNHDPNQLLGKTSSGTFRFEVDKVGLKYEVDLPDTSLGRDIETLAKRGDIDGSSFWFDFFDSVYEKRSDEDGEIWELREVKGLIEMGPVTVPAYKATSAFKRSNELIQSELSDVEARNKQVTETLRIRKKMLDV